MKNSKRAAIIDALLILSFLVFIASCKKENSTRTTVVPVSVASASGVLAVGTDSISNDSIYVIGTCGHDHHLDSLTAAAIPAAVADYLNTTYPGYTFKEGFADKDFSGNIAGYVVIIQFNGNPIGLKFDATGNFVRVLEQREGNDLSGNGWHDGGRFNDRDGLRRDTVSLAALPPIIVSYFTSNYAQDTLIRAYKNRDGSFTVFSKNNGAFASVFDANGAFVQRVQLANHRGNVTAIDEGSLPAAIQSYLSATYPGYVFKLAFSFSQNGALQGYVVCINANGTKYAVAFDASGTFLKALTIR